MTAGVGFETLTPMRGLSWLVALVLVSLGCAGEVDEDEAEGAGAACGEVTCSSAEYCCDARCGLCVEMEVACTEMCE